MPSLGSLELWSVVKIKEYGSAVDFYVFKHNACGTSGTQLLRKSIRSLGGVWDVYAYGLIPTYLESGCDANVSYHFVPSLPSDIQNEILDVQISGAGSSRSEYRKAFSLSYAEVLDNKGFPTHAADGGWWLRTNITSNSLLEQFKLLYVDYATSSGGVGSASYNSTQYGYRPSFVLPAHLNVDSNGYITVNTPPSTPSSITVPSTVNGGSSLSVSWGSSSDSEGNLSGYTLQRQYNGGSWSQIYRGINRSYSDSITFGWDTVAYRVKAYDSAGDESEYRTSATRSVKNNTPPTISGSNGNLGAQTGAFSQSYTVTETDSGQTVTVVEKIDGVQKRSFTATSGQSNTFSVTAEDWIKLLNGSHSISITATDSYGAAVTRTYSFTKNETEIELTLKEPLPSEDMVAKAIMSVTRTLPSGATFTVEVCNNGNDTAPTWENVTNAILGGAKFFLGNKVKTATAWGYNFRIKVDRNGGVGECFISGVGGNYI